MLDEINKIIYAFLGLIVFLAFMTMIQVYYDNISSNAIECKMELLTIGSEKDIDLFKSTYHFTYCDIVESEGALRQFNRFVNGENVDLPLTEDNYVAMPIIIYTVG